MIGHRPALCQNLQSKVSVLPRSDIDHLLSAAAPAWKRREVPRALHPTATVLAAGPSHVDSPLREQLHHSLVNCFCRLHSAAVAQFGLLPQQALVSPLLVPVQAFARPTRPHGNVSADPHHSAITNTTIARYNTAIRYPLLQAMVQGRHPVSASVAAQW